MIEHHFPLFEAFFHINEALVAATAIEEVGILQLLNERTIDQHVDLFEESALLRFAKEGFEREAREAPNGLMAACMDGACQLSESFGLIHRVASTEGDISKWVGEDDVHDFIGRHQFALVEIP